ncbi:unnamed protein product [Echinostoma caproni]|uniref:CCHC-type domain-containing protein n=1 Tax=Echinostoma caproni TaxID=27848 RepID=A0A183A870_9TREM|nr:unnamed protein product [Echinostoma caproni]
MDYDILDEGESFDSDAVDEELEHQLYGAIFFSTSSPPSSLLESRPDPYLTHPENSQNLAVPSTQDVSRQVNHTIVTKLPEIAEDIVLCSPKIQPNETSVSSKLDAAINEPVGSVLVSSFKDHSSSECDEGFEQECTEVVVADSVSSTDYFTEESDCESISSVNVRRSKLSSSTPKSSKALPWGGENIVLGVSKEGSTIVCNAEDSQVIAQLLESSSKDPSFWRVSHEDRMLSRSRRSRDRYFNDSKNSVCSKCEKKGHLAVECRNLCTELWRQYRYTVEPGKPKPIPRKMEIQPGGCCNCGNRGHTVDECRRKPFRSNFLGPPPRRRVLVYDQKDIYKRSGAHRNLASGRDNVVTKKKASKRVQVASTKQESGTKRDRDVIGQEKSKKSIDIESRKGKSVKKKKKKVASENLPMNPCEQSLANVERSVNEKLFEQISNQLCESQQEPDGSVETPTTSGFQRRPSMDGAAFLPLESTATPVSQKRSFSSPSPRHWCGQRRDKRFLHDPGFSPFTWINERTAGNRLNDERIPLNDVDVEDRSRSEPLFSYPRPKKFIKKRNRFPVEDTAHPSTSAKVNKSWELSKPPSGKKLGDPGSRKLDSEQRKSKDMKSKKKSVHKKPKQTTGADVVPKQKRNSLIGLKLLLVDSKQQSSSPLVGNTSVTAYETSEKSGQAEMIKKKEKKMHKKNKKLKTESSQSHNLTSSHALPHTNPRGSADWNHFLRESTRVDSWEHCNGFLSNTAANSSNPENQKKKKKKLNNIEKYCETKGKKNKKKAKVLARPVD